MCHAFTMRPVSSNHYHYFYPSLYMRAVLITPNRRLFCLLSFPLPFEPSSIIRYNIHADTLACFRCTAEVYCTHLLQPSDAYLAHQKQSEKKRRRGGRTQCECCLASPIKQRRTRRGRICAIQIDTNYPKMKMFRVR